PPGSRRPHPSGAWSLIPQGGAGRQGSGRPRRRRPARPGCRPRAGRLGDGVGPHARPPGPRRAEVHVTVTATSQRPDTICTEEPSVALKRTILVVEDEKDIRELVRFHLEQEGYTVREADSGESALAQVAAERPALVVLDIMLPATDGLALCPRLRSAEATHALHILILTARAAEVDRVIGLEMGADDYITKPFSPREMVARVRAVLRRTHGEDVPQPHEVFERGRLRMDFDTY